MSGRVPQIRGNGIPGCYRVHILYILSVICMYKQYLHTLDIGMSFLYFEILILFHLFSDYLTFCFGEGEGEDAFSSSFLSLEAPTFVPPPCSSAIRVTMESLPTTSAREWSQQSGS